MIINNISLVPLFRIPFAQEQENGGDDYFQTCSLQCILQKVIEIREVFYSNKNVMQAIDIQTDQ